MSNRDLPTGFAAKSEAKVFRPVFFVDLDWSGGHIYAWNGYGSLTWNSITWVGTGHLGKISDIRESQDGRANGVTLEMSGIPTSLFAKAMANDNQGRSAKIYCTSMANDGTMEVDPFQCFDGVIDTSPIRRGAKTMTIKVQLEKELMDRRLHNRRRTHEDQQIEYPGDGYFRYVVGIANKVLVWGGNIAAAAPTAPVAAGSAGAGDSGGVNDF